MIGFNSGRYDLNLIKKYIAYNAVGRRCFLQQLISARSRDLILHPSTQVPALWDGVYQAGQLSTPHPPRSLQPSQEDGRGRRVGRRCGELNVVVIFCAMFLFP